MSKQHEALRLADACDTLGNLLLIVPGLDTFECAAELRRQHALIEELREACKRLMGSLGVMIGDPDNDGDIIFARAALAKAEAQ
jgi:hypothetical protein